MTAMTVPAPGTGGSVAAANAALADMGMTRPGGGPRRAPGGHRVAGAGGGIDGRGDQPAPGPPLSLTAPVTAGEGW